MNDSSQNPSSEFSRYLSPRERSFLMAVRRRRQASRRLKRLKEAARRARGIVLALAFAVLSSRALAEPVTAPADVGKLFQEANSEAQAGRTGLAILHYERAQWLAPQDGSIARKLAATRDRAGLTTSTPALPIRAARALSFDALTALASVSLVLFCFLVLGTRLIPVTLRAMARRVAGAAAAVAVLAGAGVAVRWPELQRAVVLSPDTTAHIAPAGSAAAVFEVKPGEIVQVERSYGAFLKIKLADGRAGWLPRASVEKIIPSVPRGLDQRS